MATQLAYGFVDLAHLASQRVTAVGVGTIYDAIRVSAEEHNRNVQELLAAWAERTVKHQERYYLPGVGTLQPLDEHGHPLPVTEAGFVDVGYPIQSAGTAWGGNRISWELMSVEEASRHTVEGLKRDADWMRRHALAAVFDNVQWVFADKLFGNVTVEPLANGDATIYVRVGGLSAVDNHYLNQAAGIADATNPFPTIYAELSEHASFVGPVVAYIDSTNVAAVMGLTNFVPVDDPDIIRGAGVDRLARQISRGLGDRVLGKVDSCWVVEWRVLPADYIIAHDEGQGPFVAMREFDAAALQGLQVKNINPDGNLPTIEYYRDTGFGVRNRIAAVVMLVSAGAYAIPAAYNAPLAI